MNFEGKTALISGGSRGIGLATARLLANKGAHVTIIARDMDRIQSAIVDISNSRLTDEQVISGLPVDVTQADILERELSHWIHKNGAPDVVINSAGYAYPGEFTELTLDVFQQTMNINYFGTINMIKPVLQAMIDKGAGTIVNICSAGGFLGIYGYTAYSGSKYAVRGFTEALRNEMKPRGIQVSIVYPPDTDTEQLAFESQFKPSITREIAGNAGLITPEKVAQSIVMGISKKKNVIIPGYKTKLIYRLNYLLGDLAYKILDTMTCNSWKKHSGLNYKLK